MQEAAAERDTLRAALAETTATAEASAATAAALDRSGSDLRAAVAARDERIAVLQAEAQAAEVRWLWLLCLLWLLWLLWLLCTLSDDRLDTRSVRLLYKSPGALAGTRCAHNESAGSCATWCMRVQAAASSVAEQRTSEAAAADAALEAVRGDAAAAAAAAAEAQTSLEASLAAKAALQANLECMEAAVAELQADAEVRFQPPLELCVSTTNGADQQALVGTFSEPILLGLPSCHLGTLVLLCLFFLGLSQNVSPLPSRVPARASAAVQP